MTTPASEGSDAPGRLLATPDATRRRALPAFRGNLGSATAFLLAVTIATIWIVRAMDRQETLNRCMLSGKQNCIEIPAAPRNSVYIPPREHQRN